MAIVLREAYELDFALGTHEEYETVSKICMNKQS